MAQELAHAAHYVGVRNGDDLQVFAVGCSTGEESIARLKDYSGLIANPHFKAGKQLSAGEIEVFQLGPDQFKQFV